jgi:hypothetical protein
MVVLGMTPNRRFSAPTRLRLNLAFAKALEAVANTYQLQAVEFVRRLRSRLSIEEALQRYFREVGVPAAIEETVRCRALISLAGLIEGSPKQESQNPGWSMLRPDQLVEGLRRRMQHVESTNLECRLAASMSDEAVAATHVRMALEAAEVLADEVTPDEAIMHYLRCFDLPGIDGQVVFRKALAQWAELHPLPDEGLAFVRAPSLADGAGRPRLEPRTRPEFGLRVMV